MSFKTLHITNAYHPTSGGISTFYRALLDRANQDGRPMRMIVPAAESRIEEAGRHARIYHVAAPSSPWIDKRYRLLLPSHYLPPWRSPIRDILAEEQPDIVEVCDKYSLVWLASCLRKGWISGVRRPVLVGMSCERMDDNVALHVSRDDLTRFLTSFYMRWAYLPMCDFHIANSSYTAGELVDSSRSHTRHRREVWVLPMGVDWETMQAGQRERVFREGLLQQALAFEDAVLMVYAGRLAREKNLTLLLRTLERLPDTRDRQYRLLCIGDGPMREELQKEAEAVAPGRVLWIGHVQERRLLARIYANADVFLHPNPREPFGIAPLEAMAAGLPVVVPNAGGVLSYASHQNAWLADANPEAFAKAVLDLAGDPDIRSARAAQARFTAQSHSWPEIASRFFSLYEQLYHRFHGLEVRHPAAALRLYPVGQL